MSSRKLFFKPYGIHFNLDVKKTFYDSKRKIIYNNHNDKINPCGYS